MALSRNIHGIITVAIIPIKGREKEKTENFYFYKYLRELKKGEGWLNIYKLKNENLSLFL